MFNKIQAKNLFSWENLNFEVPQGISQITGFNHDDNTSEGSGKSAILNVMCWTLFGKIPKDAKIDEVVRHGQKNGLGRVTLTNGVEIVRSRKPNDLYIKDGIKEFRGKDAKETQSLIIELIGMDLDCFCQTIYFAQNYPKKFIAANESDKAKILSDIQDLSIFDRARASTVHRLKEVNSKLHESELAVSKLEGDIRVVKSQVDMLESFIVEFEIEKALKLTNLSDELNSVRLELDQLKVPSDEALVALHASVEQMVVMRDSLGVSRISEITTRATFDSTTNLSQKQVRLSDINKAQIDDLVSRLNVFKAPDKCPTCKGSISADISDVIYKDRLVMEAQLKTLRDAQVSLDADPVKLPEGDKASITSKIADIDQELKEVEDSLRRLAIELREYEELNRSKLDLTKKSELITININKESSESADSDISRLNDVLSELSLLNTQLSQCNDSKALLSSNKVKLDILRSGFKELKSYIFQEFLRTLSSESTNFAQELFEVPIQIEFTNEAADGGVAKILTDVTLNGVSRSLGLYSGGQYRRIQLAVDLALSKLVGQRSENPINIRVLDEVMKDLSVTSMEKVVKLLGSLEGSTIMIEHSDIINTIVEHSFHVDFRDGVSYAT